jgi:hypothetical protein
MMNSAFVSSLFVYALFGSSMSAVSAEDSKAPMASFLAQGRMQPSLGLLESKEDSPLLFGGSTAEDFSDPDWAGFIQETQRGAVSHKRYDDVVSKVNAEREVDIDIHSGFRDLEQADEEEQQWLKKDTDLMPL